MPHKTAGPKTRNAFTSWLSPSQRKACPPRRWCQEKIADILSTIDARIELNKRINEELWAMAKLLYDYWFVQFDFAITAGQAAAMGKSHLEGKPYRSSGGKMVYNETLKREIPEGWHHSTIGETFKTHLGGTPSREKKEYWTPGVVNWLSSGENPSMFVVEPDERISKLGLQNSPAKLLPRGTVILSIVRHLRASILGIEAATNQSVVGIVETKAFKHCFIYPYLVREIPRLMGRRTGAQQPHINKRVLDESLLVIPDESTLQAYTGTATPLFLQIENCHRQNEELTKLRDWLLPMLMNGQVTVV
jgi:type I restriction enzyme S subunit